MTEMSRSKANESIMQIKEVLTNAEAFLGTNSTYEVGVLGLSLFYSYYALFTGDNKYFTMAEKYLEQGLRFSYLGSFKRVYRSDSIDSHISNVGRFLEFSKKNHLLDIDTNSYLKSLDEMAFRLMQSKISISDFDYNSGAFAGGHYFLSRLQSNKDAAEVFPVLLRGLEERALKDAQGDYYWISPSLFDHAYLGLSHGSAMVISLLSTLYNKGIEQDNCERIIRKTCNFLLKQKRDVEYGLFPLYLDDAYGVKPFCPCYGDIGIAYALAKAKAAGILKDAEVEHTISTIIDISVGRTYVPDASPYPSDGALTYGASGLAALLENLSTFYQDERLKAASYYWYGEIAGYARHDNQFAGYKCMFSASNDEIWNMSFGWGVIGIGMSLMRYLNPELPAFADLLMTA
jgi:lantibiotic modifying enzyme